MTKPDFIKIANSSIRDLQPYQIGKPIDEVKRELHIDRVIKLASNENSFGPSPKALAAALKTMQDIQYYPDGNGYHLKQAIANHYQINADRITLGGGSDDLVKLLAEAFAGPGKEIIYSQYAWEIYSIVCKAAGATAIVTSTKDWNVDIDAMIKGVSHNTKLIFIANPNNPTGLYITEAQLCNLLDNIPNDVIVVIDEAYYEFVDAEDYPDTLSLQQRYPNLVVTRTFSKAYALAGLRVGYCIADPGINDILNRIRTAFNVNAIALASAEVALKDQHYMEKMVGRIIDNRKALATTLDTMNLAYLPSVANFLCVDMGRAALPIYEQLLQQGIIVRPLLPYNMPHHLRITVGTHEEISCLLKALRKVMSL